MSYDVITYMHLAAPRDASADAARIPWPVLRRCRAVSKRFASVAARALEARPQVVAVGGGFNGVALGYAGYGWQHQRARWRG